MCTFIVVVLFVIVFKTMRIFIYICKLFSWKRVFALNFVFSIEMKYAKFIEWNRRKGFIVVDDTSKIQILEKFLNEIGLRLWNGKRQHFVSVYIDSIL